MPGRDPLPLPEGFSLPWKAGADLVLQLHLHPSGKPETEQSTIGFYLTDEPPRRSMVDLLLIDKKIDIPPGEKAFRTRDELTLPCDVELLGIFPHMHLIGREIKITAHPPDGEPFSLLWINDWDFNWQSFYQYAEPVKLAGRDADRAGGGPRQLGRQLPQSQPPAACVQWGEQTTDEMSAAILQLTADREADLPKLDDPLRPRASAGILAERGQ